MENENNSIKTQMQKFDHISLIYGIKGIRVLVRQGEQVIKVRAIEVLLYNQISHFVLITNRDRSIFLNIQQLAKDTHGEGVMCGKYKNLNKITKI